MRKKWIKIKNSKPLYLNIGISILVAMTKEVTKENIFEVVIKVHYRNLQDSLPHFSNGKILGPGGEELEEGKEENPYYEGLYLVYDGKEVLNTIAERLTRKKNPFKEAISTPTTTSFLERVCSRVGNTDVILAYNTNEKSITPTKSEFRNDYNDIDELLETHLPYNFVSTDGSISIREVGSKTSSAALNADVLNKPVDKGLRAILVKETVFGYLSMGKLAEFGPDGLTREFFFEYAPEHKGPFIDEEHRIVGVLREYGKSKSAPINESYVSFNQQGEVRYVPTSVAFKKAA